MRSNNFDFLCNYLKYRNFLRNAGGAPFCYSGEAVSGLPLRAVSSSALSYLRYLPCPSFVGKKLKNLSFLQGKGAGSSNAGKYKELSEKRRVDLSSLDYLYFFVVLHNGITLQQANRAHVKVFLSSKQKHAPTTRFMDGAVLKFKDNALKNLPFSGDKIGRQSNVGSYNLLNQERSVIFNPLNFLPIFTKCDCSPSYQLMGRRRTITILSDKQRCILHKYYWDFVVCKVFNYLECQPFSRILDRSDAQQQIDRSDLLSFLPNGQNRTTTTRSMAGGVGATYKANSLKYLSFLLGKGDNRLMLGKDKGSDQKVWALNNLNFQPFLPTDAWALASQQIKLMFSNVFLSNIQNHPSADRLNGVNEVVSNYLKFLSFFRSQIGVFSPSFCSVFGGGL